jgi:microcystin-dependent protein
MPVFDFPTGTITPHSSPVIPTNWVSCDGSTYDGTDSNYAKLWAVLGTTYGGTGQAAFAVPNLGSRAPVGPRADAGVSFTNPTFDTNTAGWTATTSTITRDTSVFDSSSASGRWDNTGASNALDFADSIATTLNGKFNAGTTYTIAWKMRASANAWLYGYFGDLSTANYAFKDQISSFTVGIWNTYTIDWTPTSNVLSGAQFSMNDRSSFFGLSAYYWIDSFTVTSTESDGGLGSWSGSTSHLLTVGQTGVKNHRHPVTQVNHNHGGSVTQGAHTHTYRFTNSGNVVDTKSADRSINQANGSVAGSQVTDSSPAPSATISFSGGTLNNLAVTANTEVAASSAHTNVQPEIALNYIIKL